MKLEETPYMLLGGEAEVRQLVDRFYDLVDHLPEAWNVRKVHQPDLSIARDELAKFLSGWLGGPPLYITEFGHQDLKTRHADFRIGSRERDQWLLCMNQAMEDLDIQDELREYLSKAFFTIADFVKNTG